MIPLANSAIRPDSIVRLAPGIKIETADGSRHCVVHYGTTACGEVELPAGDPQFLDLFATLAQREWTPVSDLGSTWQFESIAGLLSTFVEQEWLHVVGAEAAATQFDKTGATIADVIRHMVAAAGEALALTDAHGLIDALLDICQPWQSRKLAEPPPWSGLTLDLTPFEFSASFDASGAQFRAVAEPQSPDPSATNYWKAAMNVARDLPANWQADIARLQAVEDLFEPDDSAVPLSAFYAVANTDRGIPPNFKVYFSPSAARRGSEATTIARACKRLNLEQSWNRVRDSREAECLWTLACLDLTPGPEARFKIYETLVESDRSAPIRLKNTGIEGPAAVLSRALPPELRGFGWGMLSYTLMPAGVVRHTFGVAIAPGTRQGLVRQQIETMFVQLGLDPALYRRLYRALAAACDEPVEHSYVTVQRIGETPRITTYLAPRIYQSRFGVFETPVWPSPIASYIRDARS